MGMWGMAGANRHRAGIRDMVSSHRLSECKLQSMPPWNRHPDWSRDKIMIELTQAGCDVRPQPPPRHSSNCEKETMKTRITMTAGLLAMLASSAFGQLNTNLIVNSGGEAGPSSATGDLVDSIPGWTINGNFTVATYGASGGFPTVADPGPADRGNAFFSGGPNNTASSISQSISLVSYAGLIDSGNATFSLSGWFGGFSSQDDWSVLQLSFLDAGSSTLGSVSIGHVSAAERANLSSLLFRSTDGTVPNGATSALLTLGATRTAGGYNDGYADNLSFSLTAIPEPSTYALALGAAVLGVVGGRRWLTRRR